jgi:excisionase family DNA binding protein
VKPTINLEGSGFATRAELAAWLEFCAWDSDPDREPARFVWLGDGVGWVPSDRVELRSSRAPSKLAPQTSAAPRLLTLAEASALTRTPSETIRYWIWQGRLTSYKPGRAVLVREAELLALVESRETRAIRAQRCGSKRVVVRR